MKHSEIAQLIIGKIKSDIYSKKIQKEFMGEKLFSRKRKLSFPDMIAFVMNKNLKSYDLKLDEFFQKYMQTSCEIPSKQAVSKARIKLGYEIFERFFRMSSEIFLENNEKKKHWNGYQIYAIDGSDIEIPTTNENMEQFGIISSKKNIQRAGATASTMVDVLNGIILDAKLKKYKYSERTLALEHCKSIEKYITKTKTIIIFDRGYPSYDLLGYLFNKNIKFVMRVKETNTRMCNPDKKDSFKTAKCRNKMRTLRTITLNLNNDTKEYLITNLSSDEVEWSSFKELYFMRWGIESKYQELKNRMYMEEFSGSKSICVYQDFFVCMILSNLATMIKNTVDDEIDNAKGSLKTENKYQANRSYITGCLNYIIPGILMNIKDIGKEVTRIITQAKAKRSLIRPNRNNERNKNLNRRKHHMNYKPCI